MTGWTIYLRAPDFTRAGIIDDYSRFEATPKFNDVGTWQLDMDARAPLANLLVQPKYGIELVRDSDDQTVFSGRVTEPTRSKNAGTKTVTVVGRDDNLFLSQRVAHPQPGTASPPYSSAAYDTRTGVASTVIRDYVGANLGSGALAPRVLSHLYFPTDPAIGSTVTGNARWNNLLELLQDLGTSGGVGFKLRQVGVNLEFYVYEPTDKSDLVEFSEELGNLGDYTYGQKISDANYIYVGGQGEGTARTVVEGQDSADVVRWGRVERFEDRRDADTTDLLKQEVTKTLAEMANKYTLEFTPLHTESLQYLRDFELGDKASVVIDGERITEVIRSVRISISPDSGAQVTPALDTPGQSPVLKIFSRLLSAERRLRRLERR